VRASQTFSDPELSRWLERAESCACMWLATTYAWAPHWELLQSPPAALGRAPLVESWQRFLVAVDAARAPGRLLGEFDTLEARLLDVDRELVAAEIDHSERIVVAGYVVQIRNALRRSQSASRKLLETLERIGSRCGALADGMNFRFLFDETRELFVTGYNVGNARLDPSYYDLIASEARLSSLVASRRGTSRRSTGSDSDGRARPLAPGYSLLSWSGSMFEYLMPLLVTKSPPNTCSSRPAKRRCSASANTAARSTYRGASRSPPSM
jgi:cyclic beta-1,2-glucan synthetase